MRPRLPAGLRRLRTPGTAGTAVAARVQRRATRANAATALGAAAVLVLTGATAAAAFGGGDGGATRLTIEFTRTVGLYTGSSVRMLGVSVGTIDKITPAGDRVKVDVTVDSGVRVPADATATIVPPSLVADRYIQVDVYRSGATMADRATIPLARTQVPVEKDQLVASLDKLDTALGPDGSNADGALSRLITTGAKNLKGEGTEINQTLKDVTDLVTVLDSNGPGITGTVDQLDRFSQLLVANDGAIKTLYTNLSVVSAQLEDDRSALATAFQALAEATKQLGDLAKGTRTNLKGGVDKLVDITNILVQEKASIEEILDDTPQALVNLSGAYGPATQTLDVRTNLPLSDSSGLGLLGTSGLPSAVTSPLCSAASSLPSPTLPGGALPGTLCLPGAVASALPGAVPSCVPLPGGTLPTGVPTAIPTVLPTGLPLGGLASTAPQATPAPAPTTGGTP